VFFLVAIVLLAASHQKTQSCENWQVIDQQINFTGILFFRKKIVVSFIIILSFSFEWSSLERPLKKNTDLFEKLSQSR